jgi:hypothetical protein
VVVDVIVVNDNQWGEGTVVDGSLKARCGWWFWCCDGVTWHIYFLVFVVERGVGGLLRWSGIARPRPGESVG